MKMLGMLSFRDGWDHYLLICVCLYVLFGCGRILCEEYGFNFHRKKRGGQDGQEPGEQHNASGGNLGKLSTGRENNGHVLRSCYYKRITFILGIFFKLVKSGGNLLLKFFGFVHGLFINKNP